MIRTLAVAATPPEITFNQFFEPPLEAGTYLTTASQHVSGTGPAGPFSDAFAARLTFAVQGLRFSLPPSYLQTQFPQPAGQGEYANVLPHVVLTANTLPWQRDPAVPGAGSTRYPWLALLVFDEADPVPVLATGTLADLAAPPATVACYPGLALEYGQSLTDPVRYLDVPTALFLALVPTSQELQWLTHARTLSEAALLSKATTSTGSPPGQEFAVVVGNRLPLPGHRTTCCLVSLENMGPYLPDFPGGLPAGTTAVRLAALASWSFASVSLPETFAEYLQQLNASPATPQVPYANATGTANPTVQAALAMGYTALGHHTRQGGALASWYRGPLLPFKVAAPVQVPVASADALTTYDPTTGMPDVSLGAAWQLGRLLALNDRAFATTLYNWRRGEAQAVVTEFEQQFLASGLQPDPPPADARPPAPGLPFYAGLVRDVVRPALAAVLQPPT